MLRRQSGLMVTAGLLAGVLSGGTAAAATRPAAGPAGSARRVVTICRQHHWRMVTGARGKRYVIENGNFAGRAECIANTGLRPNFTITRSGADRANEGVVAYPFALYGCSWRLCTPRSGLPARLSRVRHASASWSFGTRAPGQWNAAFDVWFGRHRSAINGQAGGAELMIWLNARGNPPGPSEIIRVDGRRWHFHHWVAANDGIRWNYVQLRAVRPVTRVRNLRLLPVIHRVQRMGLIRSRWWLLNIESGFEIWRGGRGLRTTDFSATVRR